MGRIKRGGTGCYCPEGALLQALMSHLLLQSKEVVIMDMEAGVEHLGRATARAMAQSPWRVALVASSSWSHAFLTPKNYLLHPDVEADRALYDKLRAGDYEAWRKTPLASLEESGQQEMLNWMCLAGAMAELGRRPDATTFVETYIFNSSKCFASFPG
jgi:hypothetical protein